MKGGQSDKVKCYTIVQKYVALNWVFFTSHLTISGSVTFHQTSVFYRPFIGVCCMKIYAWIFCLRSVDENSNLNYASYFSGSDFITAFYDKSYDDSKFIAIMLHYWASLCLFSCRMLHQNLMERVKAMVKQVNNSRASLWPRWFKRQRPRARKIHTVRYLSMCHAIHNSRAANIWGT